MSTSAFSGGTTAYYLASTSSAEDGMPGIGNVVRVVNAGAQVVFIKTGGVGVVATDEDFVVLPNSVAFMSVPATHTNLAAISAASTSAVYISRGYLTP